jgi:ATP-dependent RNA helicase DeaD
VYGGQSMQQQIRRLTDGVHVVVGTPGRVMDHVRRGTLGFEALGVLVLDEADEMLRMGFIDDVEWLLARMPASRQTALFSATMPREIRRIAERHLRDPERPDIAQATLTVPTVQQRFLAVVERQKLDALTRVLDVEAPEGALVFVRTKTGAADVGQKLQARGYAAEAMHGDMTQPQRESVVRRLRAGQLEVVVATDVAARGLDVERISHVVNFDAPYDAESYVHRIGRTGRAGRGGTAILFVTPRETRLMKAIERYTGQRIAPMRMPSAADVAARRAAAFKAQLASATRGDGLEPYLAVVEELSAETGLEMAEIAAAAARLAAAGKPLGVADEPEPASAPPADGGMTRLYIDAGRQAGVRPADVVGAIAGEADIAGRAIGAIDVYERFTFVEVPAALADQVLERMQGVRIHKRPVRVKLATPPPSGLTRAGSAPRRPPARRRARRAPAA